VLPGFEQSTWPAGCLVAVVEAVAVVAEEEDAGNQDEGPKDGGEDSRVDV
jgi:hypothetical protein